MADKLDNIKQEIEKTLNELKEYGKNITFDSAGKSFKELNNYLDAFKLSLTQVKNSASELADEFRTTTDTLNAAYNSLEGIDKFLKSSLSSEFRKLDTTIKSIKNTHQSLLGGYADEKKILNNINKLKNNIANIELDKGKLNENDQKVIDDLLKSLEHTESLAKNQLEIAQHSKVSTENISKFSNLLSKIPIIGESLSKPFKDVSDEIQNNITKEQTLTLELNAQKEKRKILFEQIKNATKAGKFDLSKELKEDFKKSLEKTKDFKEELDDIPSKFDIIKNKIKQVSIQGLAIGILTKAFITLKDVFKEMDEQSTQLARSLSMGKDEGVQLRNAFNEIAQSSTLTTKELVEGQLAFTKLTGIAGKLSEANLKTLSEVRSQIGSSEEAQKGLISFAHTTGKSYKEISNTVLGTSRISQTQVGLMMDQKEILDEVLKTSSILRIQFGNNADEITKAVVEAKRLGFTLKDIEGVQSNLLNFESSIAAELEAELLTGKELNLEKARYYALQGDIRGLTQEINKNIGSSVEFENMNVIAREAFAKSLGFSADKLAEILITQEQNDKIAKSLSYQTDVQNRLKAAELKMDMDGLSTALARGVISEDMIKSLGKQEQKQIAQLSMQQQFNAAVENMKSIFTSLVQGPAGQFMTSMTKLLDLANNSTFGRIAAKLAMGTGLAVAIGVIAANIIRGATPGTPMFVKEIGLSGGGIGKAISSLAKVIGIIGLITESLSMISDAFSAFGSGGGGAKEFWSGKNIGRMIGGAIGGAIAAPTGIGIPAGIGIGMMVGGMIGNVVSPVESVPKIQNAMGDDSSLTPLHDGGIITKATPAVVHPNEAVVPLDPFYAKLDELIVEVKAIGNMRVVLDDGILIGHMTNGGTKTGG